MRASAEMNVGFPSNHLKLARLSSLCKGQIEGKVKTVKKLSVFRARWRKWQVSIRWSQRAGAESIDSVSLVKRYAKTKGRSSKSSRLSFPTVTVFASSSEVLSSLTCIPLFRGQQGKPGSFPL